MSQEVRDEAMLTVVYYDLLAQFLCAGGPGEAVGRCQNPIVAHNGSETCPHGHQVGLGDLDGDMPRADSCVFWLIIGGLFLGHPTLGHGLDVYISK